ncbi:MAG: hypothetical protein US83_C0010G0001 [Candidatus Falkowbacteria bacterium GW2011_GWC2_38_22]|uniref:Uncharacterized protein n=1 Tax=Candidatus Falkowbacteria bacterium GW2011_GWE1_38_31 TaxID=1618638 RepID=A0A0G0JRT9_9BACT|nr:MAG: hypothetical protein US73_C0005G0001 [Candidatus Falkowbacteria bacterium GW2011_GWF2_38_1205]KKQ60967.1 MAG: hypothetical protein US83_C0010G0001 [Candidatus Falkowbacteria bacterium GW2011_GWC2_38_22]KKQ63504.1 MAG: hypothetical protein US84_C0006G0107 [Candidatus Falkowbacteria bacterium GW2011_GWF1_38_22]KKQ65425.1 MAG: hypothetical protein US87_C0007G0001 [Candidatus Falkowbacteria bacterium GW2011_GWE2_38_254]KKQ70268.1 MAG: hypothetical protein US91_C0006G0107 [Candidatus Falkowb
MRPIYKIQESGKITKDEIKELLTKYYTKKFGGSVDVERELYEYDIKAVGLCKIYALAGTPPKGYAMYIPEIKFLRLLNPRGKSFKEFEGIIITETK